MTIEVDDQIKGVNTSVFTNRVKELRESAELSVYSLAVICGFVTKHKDGSFMVNSRSIYNVEDGKGVNVITALAIYKGLKSRGLANTFEDVFDLAEFEPNTVR